MKSKTAKIFKGTPNASFEEDYQLYNKSISYLLKKNGNKYEIIKTYSSPIEATRDRDKNYNDNKYLLHYSFNDKTKMGKLKKGSAAAKAFMAKIRAKKGKPKKTVAKKVGSTLLINKGENPRKKAKRIIRVDRTKKGTFKKFTTISGMKKYNNEQLENIRLTRVNNDVNGNPRYVVHFLVFLNEEEQSFLPFSKKYEYALKKAKIIGGKKFHNKQYGGGIVFQSYNTDNLKENIIDVLETTPKIKY
jgi:hypothetical protein